MFEALSVLNMEATKIGAKFPIFPQIINGVLLPERSKYTFS